MELALQQLNATQRSQETAAAAALTSKHGPRVSLCAVRPSSSQVWIWLPASHQLVVHDLGQEAGSVVGEARRRGGQAIQGADQIYALSWNTSGELLLLYGARCLTLVHVKSSPHALAVSASPTPSKTDIAIETFPIAQALFRSRTPARSVVQVAWHPLSAAHLVVLTDDDHLRLFAVNASTTEPEQDFSVSVTPGAASASKKHAIACFAFAWHAQGLRRFLPHLGGGWMRFAVYLITRAGLVYIMCPVVPYKARLPKRLLDDLVASAKAGIAEDSHTAADRRIQRQFALQLQWLNGVMPLPPPAWQASEQADTDAELTDALAAASLGRSDPDEAELPAAAALFDPASAWVATRVPPLNFALNRLPAVQGPLSLQPPRSGATSGATSSAVFVPGQPPCLLTANDAGRITVHLVMEAVQAQWRAVDEPAPLPIAPPSLLVYEDVQLPDTQPARCAVSLLVDPSDAMHVFALRSDGVYRLSLHPWAHALSAACLDCVTGDDADKPPPSVPQLDPSSLAHVVNTRPIQGGADHPLGVAIIRHAAVGHDVIMISPDFAGVQLGVPAVPHHHLRSRAGATGTAAATVDVKSMPRLRDEQGREIDPFDITLEQLQAQPAPTRLASNRCNVYDPAVAEFIIRQCAQMKQKHVVPLLQLKLKMAERIALHKSLYDKQERDVQQLRQQLQELKEHGSKLKQVINERLPTLSDAEKQWHRELAAYPAVVRDLSAQQASLVMKADRLVQARQQARQQDKLNAKQVSRLQPVLQQEQDLIADVLADLNALKRKLDPPEASA